MPWKETSVVNERGRFVQDHASDLWEMSELCQAYGVSRRTGYRWIERYERLGIEGLRDLSRAPVHQPNRTSAHIENLIFSMRELHPRWGPRKLRILLMQQHPMEVFPAASTIGDILRRNGLVIPRQRRRRSTPTGTPFPIVGASNDSWACDFKGWFLTGDGSRCNPLTVSDLYSRYILGAKDVSPTNSASCRPVFERLFRTYGIPVAMRSDNGPPFASTGIGGLTQLSVWWIRLGIRLERIQPGHPEQNGIHERMHRTLKAETASPPCATLRLQRQAFSSFVKEFNQVRPHEAIGDAVPSSVYQPSPRPYPTRLSEPVYPGYFERRRVLSGGSIKWRRQKFFLGAALTGEVVGLEQINDRQWRVWFGPVSLAVIDRPTKQVLKARKLYWKEDEEKDENS